MGAPRELYDAPANQFVMGFLGPVSRLGERLVRPHDIVVDARRATAACRRMVTRVVHLGFEVRVELTIDGEESVSVQLTRDRRRPPRPRPGRDRVAAPAA